MVRRKKQQPIKPTQPPRRRKKKSVKAATIVPDVVEGAVAPPLPPAFYEMRDNPPKDIAKDFSPVRMTCLCELIAGGLATTHSTRILGLTKIGARWRKSAPKYYDGLIALAESIFVADRLAIIRKASEKRWQAAAWELERRLPGQFGRQNREGKGAAGPVNIIVTSSIPRPYEVARRIGVKRGEPGNPPDEVEAAKPVTSEIENADD